MKVFSSILKLISRLIERSKKIHRNREYLVERRDFVRYPHFETAFYYDLKGRHYETRTINLSNKGVKFVSFKELPEDISGEILMILNGSPLRIPLKIVWAQKAKEAYEYGAQFVSRSPRLNYHNKRYTASIGQNYEPK